MIGFLVAPLVPGLVLEAARLSNHAIDGLVFVLYTYPVAWVFGPPAYLVFRRYGLARLWHYAVGGFLGVGGVVFVLVALLEWGFEETSPLEALTYSVVMGALAASATATFWVIAVRGMDAS